MKFSADNQLFTQISNILRKVDFCGNNIGSPLLYGSSVKCIDKTWNKAV